MQIKKKALVNDTKTFNRFLISEYDLVELEINWD